MSKKNVSKSAQRRRFSTHIPSLSKRGETAVHEFIDGFPLVQYLNGVSGLPTWIVFLTIQCVIAGTFTYFWRLVAYFQCIGVIFPAFVTARVLEADSEQDILYMIKYWVVFSLSVLGEPLLDGLFRTYLWYFVGKQIFWFILCFPFTHAAVFLYDACLQSIFSAHREHIDRGIDVVKYKSLQATRELRGMSTQLLRQASTSIAVAAINTIHQSSMDGNTPHSSVSPLWGSFSNQSKRGFSVVEEPNEEFHDIQEEEDDMFTDMPEDVEHQD